jgi:hypothetical protein
MEDDGQESDDQDEKSDEEDDGDQKRQSSVSSDVANANSAIADTHTDIEEGRALLQEISFGQRDTMMGEETAHKKRRNDTSVEVLEEQYGPHFDAYDDPDL